MSRYGVLSFNSAGTLLENFNQFDKVNPANNSFLCAPHCNIVTQAFSQAIECLLGAAQLSPNDANIYSKLGLNYGKNGNLDSAMQHFDIALTLDPTHAMARSNKAVALERLGKQEVCAAVSPRLYPTRAQSPCRMRLLLGKKWFGLMEAIWTQTRCKESEAFFYCLLTNWP